LNFFFFKKNWYLNSSLGRPLYTRIFGPLLGSFLSNLSSSIRNIFFEIPHINLIYGPVLHKPIEQGSIFLEFLF